MARSRSNARPPNKKLLKAADLLGKHLLVGLTYMTTTGKIRETVQLHGKITDFTRTTIHFDRMDGQGSFSVPYYGHLEAGEPGAVYTLKSTGEKVSNVDFISTWTINPPKKKRRKKN